MSTGQSQTNEPIQIGADKKVIEWGWDEPGPAFMRANAARMDTSGFDGVIFHTDAAAVDGRVLRFDWHVWGPDAFEYSAFAQHVEDLRAAHATFKNMTDNFMRFNVCPGTVDWFDDKAFAVVAQNAAVAGRVSKAGGGKGYPAAVGNPQQYGKHARLAFGIWMDHTAGVAPWDADDIEKNYFIPEEFEYSVFCGLDVADKYVWVYTEQPKWWTSAKRSWWKDEKLPRAYNDALRRVRNPRRINDAAYLSRKPKEAPGSGASAASAEPNYGGARLYLYFGAVDETATVWVNGEEAGGHYEHPDLGWDKRFGIDVTGKLEPGKVNTIAVRVGNDLFAGGIWKSIKLAVSK